MGWLLGPVVAGHWYPDDPGGLRREIDRRLTCGGSDPGRACAVVAPHAGLVYSGDVAGAAFRTVRRGEFERVVVLGPSHYHAIRGAVVPPADAWVTPLGRIPLDRRALEGLLASPHVRADRGPFAREHAIEIELPFLQRALPGGFELVPMLIGCDAEGPAAEELAAALRPWIDDRTLVVASSDFTHYGETFGYVPFRDRVPERLRELDLGAIARIEAGDAEGLERYLDRTGATVCGRHAIGVALRALPAGVRAKRLDYDTSGRMTGDWSHTVSYAAIAWPAERVC